MNITLYQASENLAELLSQVDPETGALPDEIGDARDVVARKATSVAAHILNTRAHVGLVKARAKELADAARREEKRLAWLERYLAENMAATGVLSIVSEDGLFGAKLERERDASVEVFQPELLPPDYLREIPASYEPDKALITRAIKDGHEVPGARIVRKDRLTIK